jgi:lipopolysaccharide export system protein LptA
VKRSPAAFRRDAVIVAAMVALAVAIAGTDAGAQAPKNRPKGPSNAQASTTTIVPAPNNALQGFSANRGKPIKIAANQLEVRDKEKIATFSGDVHVIQGDTDLRCKVLVVYYEDDVPNAGAPAAQAAPGGQQQIRRMEAKGSVIVTQKDQTATGDNADYDVRLDTVTLTGNVVVTQGQNVLRGQKLVANTTTGVSRMEMPSGGRVEGLFQSSTHKGEGQGALPRPARPN